MGECFPSTPWQPPPNLIDMAQTSIHFQPVKGGSEEHNQRTKKLDYVHHELSSHNDYWQSCSQESRLAFVADNAKAKTGRKMQAKATPIREAVVVIKDTTTMDDLKDLSKRLHDRFGIEVFQIAIHKDEGYMKSKDGIKLNLHAHLVADWTDHETGKSLKLNRNDMSEMQTLVAECLKMERGKSSEKQHLSAIQFKIKAEEERAAAQNKAIALQSILGGLAINAVKKELSFKKAGIKYAEEQAEKEWKNLKEWQNLTWEVMERKQKIAKEVDKLRSEAIEIKSSNNSLLTTQKALKSEVLGLTGQKNSLKADIDEQITEWNERKSEAEKAIKAKEEAEKDIKSLRNFEFDLNMQLDVVTGEVVKQEQWRDSLKEEVNTLIQERDKAKRETAAARESLQNLTKNKDKVQNWKWGFNELIKLIQPILDAIKRFAHVDGRGARFTPGEVAVIDFALGRDEKREERAARYTRWAEEEEERPSLYGGYRYQCAGEHMKMIANNAAGYYNNVSQNQRQGRGY